MLVTWLPWFTNCRDEFARLFSAALPSPAQPLSNASESMRTVTAGPGRGVDQVGDSLHRARQCGVRAACDLRVVTDCDHDRRNLATCLLPCNERLLPSASQLFQWPVSFGQVVSQWMSVLISLCTLRQRPLNVSHRLRYFGHRLPVLSSVGVRGILTSPDSMASTRAKSEMIHSKGIHALSLNELGYIGVAEQSTARRISRSRLIFSRPPIHIVASRNSSTSLPVARTSGGNLYAW